jgi:hypothetical protein
MLREVRPFGLIVCIALIGDVAAGDPQHKPVETWWSLKPLTRPPLPPSADPSRERTPIDRFIRHKLHEHRLAPAPEADRRTLARRLFFDLIGLPPTPEQIDTFVADSREDAYEQLVERLLASPHYGERWGRHWLDVVHFGETHGYDKDKLRPNAWPYRDYVVRAMNTDKPYSRFVREQLAGDRLFPNSVDGVEALGFIAAGPWDFIGHAEVPESKIDGKIARHLDRDDMVTNTMMTFMSLTVQCAQCHNHKFDPITQEDYYGLQAVFAALDRADKKYYPDPVTAAAAGRLESTIRTQTQRRLALDAEIAKQCGPELAQLDGRIAAAKKLATASEKRPEYGYHSAIEPKQDRVKWVQIDFGTDKKIDRVVLVGCHDEFNNIGAGFGFPVRYRVEISNDSSFKAGVETLVDQTRENAPNPGVAPQTTQVDGKSARYLRVTATKLALRQNDFIFALAEVQVFDATGKNIAFGATVSALDSIEAGPRWRKSNLVDGIYIGQTNVTGPPVADLQKQRKALIDQRVDAGTRREYEKVETALAAAERDMSKLPPPAYVYAGTVHHGSGTFAGTGASSGKPRIVHLLPRGDIRKPGKEVEPGALSAITHMPSNFSLGKEHAESDRRAALANWIADPQNPLTWRSIVNRVWRGHFGRGIVESPNDFGRMGQLPSHPELLDWLACEFRDSGGSMKRLHRIFVNSATYRQASSIADSKANPKSEIRNPQLLDADNRLYWRMNRRRLEAEAIRDATLAISGQLNRRMTGPSFQDFVIEKPEHSPHYQYHLYDVDDPRSHRRSIYRFLVRSQQQPFMTTLDCADPSMQVDRRNETLSPLQALALLNNDFMLSMSRHFAARVERLEASREAQPAVAFRLALGREPSPGERQNLAEYSQKNGLANTCRVILNLNEYVFVD